MSLINTTQVSIDTVVPAIQIGEVMISADRRSTKDKPLTDSERIRRIVLPSTCWSNFAAMLDDKRSQELTDILRTKLQELAGTRLRDTLEADPLARVVELAHYSIPALLSWSAETASSRGSISFTRDEVTAWFTVSETRKALAVKHASNPKLAAILALVEKRFGTLAAKNHGLTDEAEALKLTTMIAMDDITGTMTVTGPDGTETVSPLPTANVALVTGIVSRLEHIAKSLAAKANEATVSMDDI